MRELGAAARLYPGELPRMAAHEWIPTASTRLEAHVRLTAMIAPEAKGAVPALRNGCESRRVKRRQRSTMAKMTLELNGLCVAFSSSARTNAALQNGCGGCGRGGYARIVQVGFDLRQGLGKGFHLDGFGWRGPIEQMPTQHIVAAIHAGDADEGSGIFGNICVFRDGAQGFPLTCLASAVRLVSKATR